MLPLPLLFAGCATTAKDATASVSCRDPRLKIFAAQKRQQTDEFAARLDLTLPPEARAFFRAAETGNWRAVSNAFERIHSTTGPTGTNSPAPGLNNVLFIPIHETFGAYEQFISWDGTLLQKYADNMLHSLPNGSIYFGGTAAGRFIITTVRDVANSPDIFILTQNWLGDARYMDYLRLLYGARLSIPSEQDVQEATRDAQARQSAGQRSDTDDCCRSAEENMNINATLAKWIFDHNKADHEVYVEESFVIPWMFPYLEPHGLIMKLNNKPLDQLDPAIAARDHQFWDSLTKSLLADPSFLRNERARQAYGKLRSAIGGLYAYGRRMTNDAEVAFKQAIELDPTGPEANFRLAQLHTEQGRIDDAIATLKPLQQRDPTNQKLQAAIQAAITQLQTMKQAGLRTTGWLMGPSFFRQGDSIMIAEVRASSSEFKVGDTVKVTGLYTLSSKPRALLCLNVTATGRGDAWEPQALEQELQVAQGSGEFVLPATIQQAGHLHLTFYDVDTGNPFGGFYFGTNPQMQEIANWNVRRWYAKE